MDKFEQGFNNRVASKEENKALKMTIDEVMEIFFNPAQRRNTPAGKFMLEYQEELEELSKMEKEKSDTINNARENIKQTLIRLATKFFREKNKIPDSVDLWHLLEKEVVGIRDSKEKAA